MSKGSKKRITVNTRNREVAVEATAKEMGLSRKLTSLMCNIQFEFTVDVIKKGGYEKVRFPYLGRFEVHPYRLKIINESYAKAINARQGDVSSGDSTGGETD